MIGTTPGGRNGPDTTGQAESRRDNVDSGFGVGIPSVELRTQGYWTAERKGIERPRKTERAGMVVSVRLRTFVPTAERVLKGIGNIPQVQLSVGK